MVGPRRQGPLGAGTSAGHPQLDGMAGAPGGVPALEAEAASGLYEVPWRADAALKT